MPKNNKINLKKIFSGEAILNELPEFAYVFDKEGRLVIWNENVEKVLGYSKEELQNRHIFDFHDPVNFERVLAEITKVFTAGKERTLEYNLVSKSGNKNPIP